MKRSERGFTLIELLVAMAIVALIAGAATMTAFQVINVTKRSNDYMTVIRQVQNAGYWISHDALMAQSVITGDDPETEDFLIFRWTEWHEEKKKHSIYHEVTYSFQDLSDGIGKLKRQHLIYDDEDVIDETILVAEYIYYNPDDPDATKANYDSPVLTMRIAASLGEAEETKEYQIYRRPQIFY